MMTDYFLPMYRVEVTHKADGLGGYKSIYRRGAEIRGLILKGSRGEHERGASETSTAVGSILHTYTANGIKHEDVLLWRGHYYRVTSDAIPVPPQSRDTSWESFTVEEIHPEASA